MKIHKLITNNLVNKLIRLQTIWFINLLEINLNFDIQNCNLNQKEFKSYRTIKSIFLF